MPFQAQSQVMTKTLPGCPSREKPTCPHQTLAQQGTEVLEGIQTAADLALCTSALLAQAPPFRRLCPQPSTEAFLWGKLEYTFFHSDSIFSTFSTLDLPSPGGPFHPGSIQVRRLWFTSMAIYLTLPYLPGLLHGKEGAPRNLELSICAPSTSESSYRLAYYFIWLLIYFIFYVYFFGFLF